MGVAVVTGRLPPRAGRLRAGASQLAGAKRGGIGPHPGWVGFASLDRGWSGVRRLIPRGRRGTAWRFLAAAVVVIGATAATTAVAGLLQVNTLVNDLGGTP